MTDWQLKLQNEQGSLQVSYQGGDEVVEIYTSTPKNPKAVLLMSVPMDEFASFITKVYGLVPDTDE